MIHGGIIPFSFLIIFCMLNASTGPGPCGSNDDRVVPLQPDPMTTTHALPGERLKLLSLREVAETLRVAPVTIHRLVARRALPVYRIARKLFFRHQDVMTWLEGQRTDSLGRT